MRSRSSTAFFSLRLASYCAAALVAAGPALRAADDSFKAPDSILLKDGRTIHGLILKNTRDEILMQERFSEKIYPKSEIVRIRDEADIGLEYTDIERKGDLPAWRVIANDLRTNDAIKSMVEIPATLIDNGEFKNVPYKSFRVNDFIELNIYGDPEDPAGLEFGVYGVRSHVPKLRKTLRSYLAGFLTSRAEVAALYGLDFNGGLKQVGCLTFEITPKSAPDAYGAWWISIYDKKRLDGLRLDDQEYARLVKPMNEVIDRRGRVRNQNWTDAELDLSEKITLSGTGAKVLLRGFYRDKNGDFRLVTSE